MSEESHSGVVTKSERALSDTTPGARITMSRP